MYVKYYHYPYEVDKNRLTKTFNLMFAYLMSVLVIEDRDFQQIVRIFCLRNRALTCRPFTNQDS